MANKKINQLVSKTAILSTDIFGIGDATTGQLFKKTIAELQAAIGGAVISVNGLVGTVVLDTDDIAELVTPTNKWFTDARARGAISLTVTGNSGASTYSSGTGVLNVPTYTLAGLGGISLTSLSGGTGITYNNTTGAISYSGTVYTDASVRALFSGSTGISYNSSTGAISYSGTVYTDSSVRGLISMTTTGTSGASTYNNTTGVINVPNYTLVGLGGISLTSLSGGTGITYNSSTGAISYSGTVYTDASVRALISAGTGISYSNTTGVITSTITQYTDALARASVSLTTTGTSGASTYNNTTGVLNIPQYASALSGTTNYVPKFTSSSTIGLSQIFDNGTSIGIATTSPGYFFDVNGTGRFRNQIYIGDGSAASNSTINLLGTFGVSFIWTITNDANGLSFNCASPNTPLKLESSGVATFSNTVIIDNANPTFNFRRNDNGASAKGAINFYATSTLKWQIGTNLISATTGFEFNFAGSNLGLITQGGNWLLGTTSDNGERLYVSGAIRATSTITANSDIRLKSNITKIENALEKVSQINGYTYNTTYDNKRHGGVIAQEIDKVFPEIVNTGNDGLMGVEYGNISALLIEAIKEQKKEIDELRTIIASK
jgi:TfoX/Sxy family transcriptional regulator of competence genes